MPDSFTDVIERPGAVMSAGLAAQITAEGIYHGTALYHLGPEEVVDAEELAISRWDDPHLVSFGGLYVTFVYGRAHSYATELAKHLPSFIKTEAADVAPIIYVIKVYEGCEYALDEDYVGWDRYINGGRVRFGLKFMELLPKDKRDNLLKLEIELASNYLEEVPYNVARPIYDVVTREYAQFIIEETYKTEETRPGFRILNDKWEILDAVEII